MRITEEQRAILDSLVCERLSRNSSNMREIDSFFNSKNEKLVERLLNEAYSEDENGLLSCEGQGWAYLVLFFAQVRPII